MILANNLRVLIGTLPDFPVGGSIGTAPNTVDIYQQVWISQATPGQTVTIPAPTDPIDGYIFSILNIGGTALTVLGVSVLPGAVLVLHWNGAAWALQVATSAIGVTSFNTRINNVLPLAGDYTFAQISSTPTTLVGYGITDAVPDTRTVNGHQLNANIVITAADLGLVIGVNVQAWDADLDTIAANWPPNAIGDLVNDGAGNLSWVAEVIPVNFLIDGGGTVITAGVKGRFVVDFNATIIGVTLLADQAGDIVLDLWKDTYANYETMSVADTITAAAKPTLSAAVKSQDNVLTGWSVNVNAGDVFIVNVDSAATVTQVSMALKIRRR